MEKSIVIAGFGGQGVLLCGRILANIFMINNKSVTWYPCYGSEMRGGAVNCEIVVSDDEVTSVHKKQIDILVTLNDISFNKFLPSVKNGGTVIANSSLIPNISIKEGIEFIKAPISDMALKLGNIKVTNMIALGMLSNLFKNVDFSAFADTINNMFPNAKSQLLDLNLSAFSEGQKFKAEIV